MVSFHIADILIIAAYFLFIVIVGVLAGKKKEQSNDEFILAGRRLTLPGFVATLVASWYGGILGVGEFTYRYGLANWLTQGLFFYIFALVFALVFAKRIQGIDIYTIPDRLEQVYGRKAALTGSLFTFLMVSPAPYILIVGILLRSVFGWPLGVCLITGAALSTLYLLAGGFRAVIRTDIIQFLLMFSGFLILVPAAVIRFGGIGFLQANLPTQHLTFTGELTTGYILAWGFISLWTLVDPGFYQRCLAAKTGNTARNGVLITVAFWVVFDLLTCTAGLYARAALPGIEPLMAFPLFADTLLPAVFKGIFFTGMLATVMSTVDSFTFLSALTIGNDFIARLKNRQRTDPRIKLYTQAGLVVTAAGAVAIAWWSRSVIDIWYTIGTIGIPALLIPVAGSYTKRFTLRPAYVLALMTASSLTSVTWLVLGYIHTANGYPSYPFGIEPMYPGFAVSVLVFILGLRSSRKNLTT